jgi:PAS domain S-box-containing protein
MTSQRFITVLIAGILGLNFLVVGLSWFSLAKSRRQYTDKAAVTARNLAQVLEQNITGTFNKVDIAILGLANEVERQFADGKHDQSQISQHMALAHQHLPELEGLRIADAQGNVFYGLKPASGAPINISDRDYFKRLRDNSQDLLVVSKPIKGRIAGKWLIVLARRINGPDGAFAGAAFGSLSLEKIDALFSSIDVGKHGAFALRDGDDLGLVARYPEPEGIGSAVGHKKMSQEFLALLKKGENVGAYDAPSGLDRRMRTWGYRKFGNGLYYIYVGLAQDEFLTEWRDEAAKTGIFLGLFALVSAIAGWAIFLGWKRNMAAYESLRQNDERMRLFFERQIVGMAISSPDKHWLQMNDKWCSILGYEPEELKMLTWDELTHPDDLPENVDKFDRLVTGVIDDYTMTKRFIRKDGTVVVADLSVGCVRHEDGTLNYVLSLMEDITERKHSEEERRQLEQQLLHAQKLESLGVLAGGIAHDFNNILLAIIGNVDLALMRIAAESPAADNLRRIEKAAVQAADLAKQMLAYSGKGKFVVEPLDLTLLVEEMGKMLEVSLSKKARLHYNLTGCLPAVEADAGQIRQIIMNLVINGSEAMNDSNGDLTISTGIMYCAADYLKNVWLHDPIQPGHYAYIEVADTGCGMDQETLARVFDPFFTTKFTGRGLGMAAVLGIIRGHKGTIKITSSPGCGTTFRVLFPVCGKPVEIAAPSSCRHEEWQGSGTVLLVDDEEIVLGIGAAMLQELGFTTITATNGKEAIEIFKSSPNIDLVILDLTMPYMDGAHCFRELRHFKPDARVVMSSGYNEQEVTQKFAGNELAGFIQKPYRLRVLKETIKAALQK